MPSACAASLSVRRMVRSVRWRGVERNKKNMQISHQELDLCSPDKLPKDAWLAPRSHEWGGEGEGTRRECRWASTTATVGVLKRRRRFRRVKQRMTPLHWQPFTNIHTCPYREAAYDCLLFNAVSWFVVLWCDRRVTSFHILTARCFRIHGRDLSQLPSLPECQRGCEVLRLSTHQVSLCDGRRWVKEHQSMSVQRVC